MKGLKTILTLILVVILSVNLSGQETYGKIGKVFTKEEADKQFGLVLKSVVIDVKAAKEAMAKTSDYIMFTIKDDKPVITDKARNVIYSRDAVSLKSEEVLHMYSVSTLNELLDKGKSNSVILEQRKTVFSVTSGGYTMEVGLFCPPFCN